MKPFQGGRKPLGFGDCESAANLVIRDLSRSWKVTFFTFCVCSTWTAGSTDATAESDRNQGWGGAKLLKRHSGQCVRRQH